MKACAEWAAAAIKLITKHEGFADGELSVVNPRPVKLFFRDFLIAFVLTLLLGGMILLIALGLLAKPLSLDPKKPANWSVEELQR